MAVHEIYTKFLVTFRPLARRHTTDHVSRLMRVYRELVTDPAWRREQERRDAVELERLVRRLLEWDGVSEELAKLSRSII